MSPDSIIPMRDQKRPLVIFADDFGRHPSNSQHLAQRLAETRRILWVNTIGTRTPRLCLADAKRAVGKARQWLSNTSAADQSAQAIGAASANIHVINPPMWPGFGSPWVRRFNAWSMARAINRAAERWFDSPPVVLTTLPIAADLVGRIAARRWLYYAVDDWTAWPGLDHRTLAAMESDLITKADALAAVSDTLAARLTDDAAGCELIDHGIDLDIWRNHPDASADQLAHPVLQRIASLPGPRAIYWGLIDDRLDHQAIARMADHHGMSVAMVGPVQGGSHAHGLESRSGVHHLGPINRDLLPHIARLADVLIAPYAESPATRAMQPLKLKEYLATDRPVVCTRLPSTRSWADCCDAVPQHKLADRTAEAAFLGAAPSQIAARNHRLANESWATKADQLEAWIERISAEPEAQEPPETPETHTEYPRLAWDRAA